MNKALETKRLEKVAAKLRALAHPMRVAIIEALDKNKEMNVTELYKLLGLEQATTSHHLNILKSRGVVKSKRVGQHTYYSIRPNSILRIIECVSRCKT